MKIILVACFLSLYSLTGEAFGTFYAGGISTYKEGEGAAVSRMYSDAQKQCQSMSAVPVGAHQCYGAVGFFECGGEFRCSRNKSMDASPVCTVSEAIDEQSFIVSCFTPHGHREDLLKPEARLQAESVCSPGGFKEFNIAGRQSYTGRHYSFHFRCHE